MKTFFAQPLITEKSMMLANEGTYQFVVPFGVTKNQVADFVAKHFAVTVVNVTTATLRAETVRFKNRPGTRSRYKKATVRLAKGQTIADFSMPVETTPETKPQADDSTPVAETPTESNITVRSKSKKRGA